MEKRPNGQAGEMIDGLVGFPLARLFGVDHIKVATMMWSSG